MRDVVRKAMETGLGAVTSPEKAGELAGELLDWSRRNGERLIEIVRREVQRQLKIVGVATQDDLSALKKRVRTLERRLGPAEPKKPADRTAKKPSGKKKPTARSGSTAKRS